MVIKNFKDFILRIDEGLIKTQDPSKILRASLTNIRNLGLNCDGNIIGDKIEFTLYNFYYIPFDQLENIIDSLLAIIVNLGGWFPSSLIVLNLAGLINQVKYQEEWIYQQHQNIKDITFIFESKFDITVDVPDKLYHLSIVENKIKKYGLCPRSGSKLTSHLDRIYVCKTLEDCELLIPNMKYYYFNEFKYRILNKKFKKDTQPVIYEIDNTSNFVTKMYQDPNYINGYYILDNIDPKLIKLVKT